MAAVTWGALAKTINDSQTIAAYIAAQFAVHNADVSAHGQSDEAVYNHRIGEILDHLDASVTYLKIADAAVSPEKINYDKYIYAPIFESLDSLTIIKSASATINYGGGGIDIEVPASAGQNIKIVPSTLIYGINFSNNQPLFEAVFYQTNAGDNTFYIGIGDTTDDFLGFKVVNEDLYACWIKAGVEHTEFIDNAGVESTRHYVVFMPDATHAEFYIDGISVHTATTDLPTGTWDANPLFIKLTNANSEASGYGIFSVRFYENY